MKILMVNKVHYLKGGSEKYYFDLANLLIEKGHEIAFFSMSDEKNIKTECKEYFVEKVEKLGRLRYIYSTENRKKMKEALNDFKPDIVHINKFQGELSESIIEEIKKHKIPIVYTAHDLRAICPADMMLDAEQNVCEECIGGKYKNCKNKLCINNSKDRSKIGKEEGKFYRNQMVYTGKINHIITLSKFYKMKLVQDGISENKISVMNTFLDLEKYDVETSDENYALYIGALTKENGIFNLLEAFKNIENKKLIIIGEGKEKAKVKEFIEKEKLQDKVEMIDNLNQEERINKIAKSSFVVVPTIWYQNCPYSIVEAQAIGKAVIGSRIGGIPEFVKENNCGLLFTYNNIGEITDKMKMLFVDKELNKRLGEEGKKYAREKYDKEKYYENISRIYKLLIG